MFLQVIMAYLIATFPSSAIFAAVLANSFLLSWRHQISWCECKTC